MAVSIELYIIVNFFADLLLLAVIARCRGCVSWKRLGVASALGTAYAVLMQLDGLAWLGNIVCRGILTLCMAFAALRPKKIKGVFRDGIVLLGASALMGGVQILIRESVMTGASMTLLVGGILGLGLTLWLFRIRVNRVEKWEVDVIVRKGGRQVRFTALIDTGNRLHEPISGLPVLIVEQRKILELLPREFRAEVPQAGFRRVAFGGVGGNGHMNAFRPDALLVNYSDGWMRAPAVWIGVFPGYMPGDVCALAPAVLGAIGEGTEENVERF